MGNLPVPVLIAAVILFSVVLLQGLRLIWSDQALIDLAKGLHQHVGERVLVKLSESSNVIGWAPCQRVRIPPGEYIAHTTKFQHESSLGFEYSVCFVDVQQVWRGKSMKRNVCVRISDYPFLVGFPKVNSRHLQVLSQTVGG